MKNLKPKKERVGKFAGFRVHGKTYDPDGKETPEKHEKNCFCCRENIMGGELTNLN